MARLNLDVRNVQDGMWDSFCRGWWQGHSGPWRTDAGRRRGMGVDLTESLSEHSTAAVRRTLRSITAAGYNSRRCHTVSEMRLNNNVITV